MKTKKAKKVTKRNKKPPVAADQNAGEWWTKTPCEAYCQDPETPTYLTHWKTREGEVLAIRDMQFDHLLNARALLRRKIAKLSEVEEALSREVTRRSKGEFRNLALRGVPPQYYTLLMGPFDKI